jgi:3-deoxy-D-manno-octulosonic-acid transferase
MRWWLYTFLFTIAYLVMLPHFLLRMRRRGGYWARFSDRFGFYPKEVLSRLAKLQRPIWIHAVSVGEVYVAGQVMRGLRAERPNTHFVLSTTSSTGWKEAEKLLSPEDVLIYFPLDFPSAVKRALKAIKPKMLIITETEIWPNMIRTAHTCSIPLYLVNARIADKSEKGYRKLKFWFAPVLNMFTRIFAQSRLDKDRLEAIGANPDIIEVTGSFKYDVAQRAPEKEEAIRAFLARFGINENHTVLLGGSTWPGEDTILINIYKRLHPRYPNLRLVIAPRHFEKADGVQAEIVKAGFRCLRKSKLTPTFTAPPDSQAIILADTTGELMGFYGNSDIVFVGKSLCEHGAQNMIEPCLCGAATLVGPYTENFRPVMTDLLASEAIIQVQDAAALENEIVWLLDDPAARKALGERAISAVMRRTGVVKAVFKQMCAALN